MRNYRNNHKRNRFRSNGDRNFRRNGDIQKLSVEFTNSSNFKRKNPGKNNQNAAQLIEKYTELAREALLNGDKILSENYFQHADYFTRISEQQIVKKNTDITENNPNKELKEISTEKDIVNTEELKVKDN